MAFSLAFTKNRSIIPTMRLLGEKEPNILFTDLRQGFLHTTFIQSPDEKRRRRLEKKLRNLPQTNVDGTAGDIRNLGRIIKFIAIGAAGLSFIGAALLWALANGMGH